MLPIVIFLAVIGLSQARPSTYSDGAHPSFMAGDAYIIGGSNAAVGEFPWQLSQQRLSGADWSHSCGASLLSSQYGLSAAHCVDAADPSILRVIAGLHSQIDQTNAQISNIASYTMHGSYNDPVASYANDIAILNFATTITIGGNIQAAVLPADNSNQYVGLTCVISGWGRTSISQTLPDILQKAPIDVISTADCATRMTDVSGTIVWDNHICLYDSAQSIGSCNGDSGGPLNCPDGSTVVAGVTSWGVSSALGRCLQTYPSVYTRTSAYLDWITANTP
jgi:secreted trypsin-like serine protease